MSRGGTGCSGDSASAFGQRRLDELTFLIDERSDERTGLWRRRELFAGQPSFFKRQHSETQVAELHTQGLLCYPESESGLLQIAVGVLHDALK